MKKNKARTVLCVLAALVLVWGCALAAGESRDSEEIYRDYVLKRAEMTQSLGTYGDWSVQDKAALDEMLVEHGLTDANGRVRILPGAEDVPQEEALQIAWDAVVETFGTDRDQLGLFQVQYEFFVAAEDTPQRNWRLMLQSTEQVQPYTGYWIEIQSPSGQIGYCLEGESRLLPPEEARYVPLEGHITEEEAAKIAREHAMEHFEGRHPMPRWVLSGYQTGVRAYFSDELGWFCGVELNPVDDVLFDYFGTYSVCIDPQTGIVWEAYAGNG